MNHSRNIIVVNTMAFAIAFAAWVMLGPSVRVLATEFGLSAFEAAFLKSSPILVGSVMRIPIGILTDRFGARLVFPSLLAFGAVACVVMSVTASPAVLLAGALAMGMVGTTFVVGVQSCSSWSAPDRQGTALGIFGAGNVGTSLTTFGLPLLLAAAGFAWSFRVYALVLVLTAAAYWLLVRNAETPGPERTVKQLMRPLGSGSAWLFGLFYMASFGVFVALTLTLNDLYMDGFGTTVGLAAALTTTFTFTASLARIPGGWLADRFGANKTLIVSIPGSTLCLALVLLGLPLAVVGALILLCGFALGIAMTATFKLIPQHFSGSVGAVGGIVGALGGIAGFYLPLAAHFVTADAPEGSLQGLLPTTALMLLASLASWWFVRSAKPRDAQPRPSVHPTPETT